ncbi:PQQ-binding-like beta-propeller repeat protein [Moritella viscosa]|uniref:outer membrane protein assembly factor BamB family protein n=1 Tax=Moritella viscosa TaxID=80854 RepID=UPI0009114FB3|nr:hypothetical protein [Moritella viscosa]SHO12234.1 Putative uncharacterized protein [Moritella viscosa]SHO12235.1 Putative uncharacterized protein [Moritella viscosa]SHO16499.1 Putative uncharacterized protein [Moritella viscosa]SHO18330.1 Putative uncharacterized protein [Moritella viscosa]
MKNSIFKTSLLVAALSLSGCDVTFITPDWVKFYDNSKTEETTVEWLSAQVIDSVGNIIQAGETIKTGSDRVQNILLVKYGTSGNTIWTVEHDVTYGLSRSDENITAMVIDDKDNIYITATVYLQNNALGPRASLLAKFSTDGSIIWEQIISNEYDVRDLELKNNKLYVTGLNTKIFNTDGEQQLNIEHPEQRAWDIAVDMDENMYVSGRKSISKYNTSGQLEWMQLQTEDTFAEAATTILTDGSVLSIIMTKDRNLQIQAIDINGQLLWRNNVYGNQDSYALPGPVILQKNAQDELFIAFSDASNRDLIKMQANGDIIWHVSNQQGEISAINLDDNGVYLLSVMVIMKSILMMEY